MIHVWIAQKLQWQFTYDAIWNGLLNVKKRGIRIRCIVEATPENIVHCKKLIQVAQVRHLTGVRSNFGLVDRKLCLLYTIANEEQPLSHAIITNVKGIVDAQQYLFETLWSKAIPIEKKIKEIEEGIVSEFIDTFSDNDEIHAILNHLLTSTMRELLFILPTINTFLRYEKEGLLQSLKEEAKRGIKIRTFIQSRAAAAITTIDNNHNNANANDNNTITFNDEAIGLATYSNSVSTVSSYASIFDILWIQAEFKSGKNTVV